VGSSVGGKALWSSALLPTLLTHIAGCRVVIPDMCRESRVVGALIGALRTLVLFRPLHVDLHRVQLEVDFGVIVEATNPTDVSAFESMMCITMIYEAGRGPTGLTTKDTDTSIRVSPLVSHQTLKMSELVLTSGQATH